MRLFRLTIEYDDTQMKLFNKKVQYDFKGKDTLITSMSDNTQGKTSLLRFILYSLGYKITQTDGMQEYDYKTTLEIEHDTKKYFLIREKEKQSILDEHNNIKYIRKNGVEEYIPMISVLLGINNDYISNSLLGCFYIDQEKGWTLLNRGSVIGKINFNIEEFFINLDNKTEFEKHFVENKMLNTNVERANTLLKIMKDNYIYDNNLEENRKEILETIKNLEKEKNSLEQKLYLKKREIKNLENILFQNEDFAQKIEDMNIIIEYKDENIVVDRKNLKSYYFNNELLIMKKNEIDLEIKKIEKKIEKVKLEIRKIRKDNQQSDSNEYLKRTFNLLKNSGLSVDELELLKKSNQYQIKTNDKIIKKEITQNIDEFWEILLPVLNDLVLGKKYIKKEIILTDRLAGISGAQRHQLSLAFKIALNKLIENRLKIKLPFIIDSPKGSETSDRISDSMLTAIKKYLPTHQLIVSSVFDDFKIDFNNKIKLLDGVVKELDKFI